MPKRPAHPPIISLPNQGASSPGPIQPEFTLV
jgi:hypothetical protein